MHEGPHLFHAPGAAIEPAIAVRRAGAITITWETGLGLPAVSWRSDDAEVHCWRTDGLHIELALGEHRPERPGDCSIDSCWLGVFRVQAAEGHGPMGRWSKAVALPRLCCSFEGGNDSWTGGGDPGQGLDAQTWQARDIRLSIGTEDADFLCHRVRGGSTMPSSWEGELCSFFEQPDGANSGRYPVRYLDRGLALQLPPLPRGGYCEVHFASAIGPVHSKDECATWYAVDLDPRRSGPAWAR